MPSSMNAAWPNRRRTGKETLLLLTSRHAIRRIERSNTDIALLLTSDASRLSLCQRHTELVTGRVLYFNRGNRSNPRFAWHCGFVVELPDCAWRRTFFPIG